mgnify:CR=1 FL=1
MKMTEEQYSMNDSALCNIFQSWCEENGVPQMSADELLWEDGIELTVEQINFVNSFIAVWDYAMDVEANQPKTVSNIDGNEDEACRCGSTTWLYDNEGDAALCKECWK